MVSWILSKLIDLVRPRDEMTEFDRYLQALSRASARAGTCLGPGLLIDELGYERDNAALRAESAQRPDTADRAL